ncbi:MAG: hypothetical protein RIC56_19595 [Pseudomonadales bacterium]
MIRNVCVASFIAASLFVSGCGERPREEADATTDADASTAVPAGESVSESALLPLPALSSCGENPVHPELPERWRMQALLHPFHETARLAASDTYFDAGARAIYHSLQWQDGTQGAWLVTEEATYAVTTTAAGPESCVEVSTRLRPPGRDWLDDSARCAGESRVQGINAQWWKTRVEPEANQQPPTTWFWFDMNGRPWRTMFAKPSFEFGVLGLFSFNLFQQFHAVDETPIPQAIAACKDVPSAPLTIDSGTDLYAHDVAESRRSPDWPAVPQISGLNFECSVDALPEFQPSFQMTTFMSSVAYQYDPLPTRVFYRYDDDVRSMRTRMYNSGQKVIEGSDINADALLIGGDGYLVQPQQCQQVLPGIPVPNWQTVDDCRCRARVSNDPAWSQFDDQLVIQCPLEDERVFWMWYTPAGHPIVFMETGAPVGEGTSLALADYIGYEAPTVVPSGTFDVPNSCEAPTTSGYARVTAHSGGGDRNCHRCHEPLEAASGGG